MKSGRHAKILEIISEYPVETQDEIINRLKEAGYKATQATISRDIKDLRLVKTLGSDGRYRYISDNQAVVGTIAGDDTIFVACRDDEGAAKLTEYLKQYIIK